MRGDLAEVRWLLERARGSLSEARCSQFSLPQRFLWAYDAARDAAISFCVATNRDVVSGELLRRETFAQVVKALELAAVAAATERICQAVEARLFYAGTTEIDEPAVTLAIGWAECIYGAVVQVAARF